MNALLVQQVWNIPTAQIGSAVPQLRPLELDDVREIRSAFVRWLQTQRADFDNWQDAWNTWSNATTHRAGRIAFTRTHCPDCRGRRYDARHGRLCRTCITGSWRHVSTPALHQRSPLERGSNRDAPTTAWPKEGDRVTITGIMDDPDPLPVGTTGTVISINELGFDNGVGSKVQISVDWDSGRTLMLLDTDPFTTI